MITGVHNMFFTSQPREFREFVRDKLGFSYKDVGSGWLIFDLPPANMGAHPDSPQPGKQAGTHNISFQCKDINGTVAELKAKGVEFVGDIKDQGYGYTIKFKMPGAVIVELYQPY